MLCCYRRPRPSALERGGERASRGGGGGGGRSQVGLLSSLSLCRIVLFVFLIPSSCLRVSSHCHPLKCSLPRWLSFISSGLLEGLHIRWGFSPSILCALSLTHYHLLYKRDPRNPPVSSSFLPHFGVDSSEALGLVLGEGSRDGFCSLGVWFDFFCEAVDGSNTAECWNRVRLEQWQMATSRRARFFLSPISIFYGGFQIVN